MRYGMLAAVGVTLCMGLGVGGPSAWGAGGSLIGGQVTGSSNGQGIVEGSGTPLDYMDLAVSGSPFVGTSGSGGTSGGLGDGVVEVARTTLSFSATVAQQRAPGDVTLEFGVEGHAFFNTQLNISGETRNYAGTISSAALVLAAFEITGAGPMPFVLQTFGALAPGGGEFFSIEAVDGTGASINGNLLTPGQYVARWSGGVFASSQGSLTDTISGRAVLIVPGPGGAGLALAGVGAWVGRRRRGR